MNKNIQEITMSNIHDFNKDDDNGSNSGSGSSSNNPGSTPPSGGSGQGMPIGQLPSGGNSTQTGIEDLPLTNYNEQAKNGKFSRALFRDDEIEKTIGILSTQKKPNALLVGDAGVGKTQIVEEMANRIVNNDPIVKAMLDKTIYELTISSLVAGKSFVGQLEESLHDVIDFASDPENKAVLFIDEIHQLMDSKDSTSEKIAQILKPALGRGDLHVIGATTTSEATTFLSDPAFNRRFSRIIVPELSPDETLHIMKSIKMSFQNHHNVVIPDDVLERAVILGDEYRQSGSHRPDTTITLVDRALADARIQREKLKLSTDPATQQFIKDNPVPSLTLNQLKKSGMELASGGSKYTTNQTQRLQNNLDNQIIGQEEAKEMLINSVRRQQLNLVRRTKPISFLFAGLTGTGKTEMAKQLADAMFGSKDDMIYINMSEYSSSASLTRITGSSAGYIGSDSKRELPFDSLESKPYQIVLLDEFEKADKDVQRFFMQALDNGSVQSNRGADIDFSRTIIIATTNAGVEMLSQKTVGFGQQGQTLAENATSQDIITALRESFDIELINRFEHVVSFGSMDVNDYKKILAVKYNSLIGEAQENRQDLIFSPLHIDLDTVDDYAFINELADESYQPDLNGRPAERTMRKFIEDTLLDNMNNTQFTFS